MVAPNPVIVAAASVVGGGVAVAVRAGGVVLASAGASLRLAVSDGLERSTYTPTRQRPAAATIPATRPRMSASRGLLPGAGAMGGSAGGGIVTSAGLHGLGRSGVRRSAELRPRPTPIVGTADGFSGP